ncbi:hypothetical protein [Streptomyces sp. 142MFCol3.1]|uniref:hypothetical protein n=1 Tax=Streptomyces sp. 142MFCol3.1 TaxID=1172179 RepID=UPI0003F7D502|nr:hypothetical protein [Streptomyces sp. 142MFCol3.1]
MGILICVADDLPKIAVRDPDEVSVLVARGGETGELPREVQEILTIDLGAPATADAAFLCFCGTRVELPGELARLGAVEASGTR